MRAPEPIAPSLPFPTASHPSPCGPVAPVAQVDHVAPVAPVTPVAPVAPALPTSCLVAQSVPS